MHTAAAQQSASAAAARIAARVHAPTSDTVTDADGETVLDEVVVAEGLLLAVGDVDTVTVTVSLDDTVTDKLGLPLAVKVCKRESEHDEKARHTREEC